MRLAITFAVGLLAATSIAHATEAVAVPEVRVGDKWVMQGRNAWPGENREGNWKVRRVVTKIEGSVATWTYEDLPPLPKGEGENRYDFASQVILRGFVSGKPERTRFTLSVGSEWSYGYSQKTGWGTVQYEMEAKVVGWEEVVVPAGTFRALRIEHKGTWSRDTDLSREGRSTRLKGRTAATYWYAPAAKTMVKTLTTEHNATYGGIWFRGEQELVEFSPSGN